MINASLQEALNNVDLVYNDLVEIAESITEYYTKDLDLLVQQAQEHINSMTNDSLREFMFKLSLQAYSFGEIKERSSIKAYCAEILRKEKFAKEFSTSDGSVAAKENKALLSISDEILAETVNDLASNLFKTKLDSIYRLVDAIKTILMSRMQEAKLSNIGE